MDSLIPIIKAVLMNKYVIEAAIASVLLMNFASYVVRYRKKPPKPRVKKVAVATPTAPSEGEGGDEASADDAESSE